jgi:hypothetical protein
MLIVFKKSKHFAFSDSQPDFSALPTGIISKMYERKIHISYDLSKSAEIYQKKVQDMVDSLNLQDRKLQL